MKPAFILPSRRRRHNQICNDQGHDDKDYDEDKHRKPPRLFALSLV